MQKNAEVTWFPLQPAPRAPIAKTMAYGPSSTNSLADSGGSFRNDRGKPYYRAGQAVKVVPQFKGQKIAVANPNSAALPTSTITSGATATTTVSYPTGTKMSTGSSKIPNVF